MRKFILPFILVSFFQLGCIADAGSDCVGKWEPIASTLIDLKAVPMWGFKIENGRMPRSYNLIFNKTPWDTTRLVYDPQTKSLTGFFRNTRRLIHYDPKDYHLYIVPVDAARGFTVTQFTRAK